MKHVTKKFNKYVKIKKLIAVPGVWCPSMWVGVQTQKNKENFVPQFKKDKKIFSWDQDVGVCQGITGTRFRITYLSFPFDENAVTVLYWYKSNPKIGSRLKKWRMGMNSWNIYHPLPTSLRHENSFKRRILNKAFWLGTRGFNYFLTLCHRGQTHV